MRMTTLSFTGILNSISPVLIQQRLCCHTKVVSPRRSRFHPSIPERQAHFMMSGETPLASELGLARSGLGPVSEGHMRVVCVGDMHDQWDEVDENALAALNPDIILFVGDYGNENVQIVQRISEFAKSTSAFVAAVLGNHDGFYSMSEIGRQNCPYNATETDRVQQQIDFLESVNPAYRSLTLDGASTPVSVVGGRPLTWGGPNWKCASFYRKYYRVSGMKHSSDLISKAAIEAKANSVIFLSHNGPTGLGEAPSDPCGKDFGEHIGGDFGDDDLRLGIEAARTAGKDVPLVVFGHMHHRLQRGGERIMLKTEKYGNSGKCTVMLDTAVVPRHRKCPGHDGTMCQFTVAHLDQSGNIDSVEQVWVKGTGEVVEASVLLDRQLSPIAASSSSCSRPANTS